MPDAQAVTGVYLTREDGVISLERPYEDQALISLPGQTPQEVSVPMRTIEDCLTEELRRIDPDEIYAEVISSAIVAEPCQRRCSSFPTSCDAAQCTLCCQLTTHFIAANG